MRLEEGGAELFNFDIAFSQSYCVALAIAFLFYRIYPAKLCKKTIFMSVLIEVIHSDGQNTNVGYSHLEEGGGRIALLRRRGD